MYQFSVCIIVQDRSTENTSLFDRLSTFYIDNVLLSDLTSDFKYVTFEHKCVRKDPITHHPMFLIADIPHLIKKIVSSLEISSLNKLKLSIEFD